MSSQRLRPGVVCVDSKPLGKAALNGGLQGAVVRNASRCEIAYATQIGECATQRTCSCTGVGNHVEGGWLIDVVDRLGKMLSDVADVSDSEDVGTKLLLDLKVELLDESRPEVGSLCNEPKTRDRGEVRKLSR